MVLSERRFLCHQLGAMMILLELFFGGRASTDEVCGFVGRESLDGVMTGGVDAGSLLK